MHYLLLRNRIKNLYDRAKLVLAKLLNDVETLDSIKNIPGAEIFSGLTQDLELTAYRNMVDFQEYYNSTLDKRLAVEKYFASKYKNKISWIFKGYCQCCERDTDFLADWRYSDGVLPNYRERLVCSYCGLNNRQRFVGDYLKKVLKNRKEVFRIYCYEQVTNFYQHMARYLSNADFTGSEYLGHNKKNGEIIAGIRHEDALSLSFDSGLFDFIISNDVYEHVPDVKIALGEAYRCLKKNGVLIFSIPFFVDERITKQRVTINEEGEMIHLFPEQYHGNPLSQKGSLVFYDFGWDILDYCKEKGFKDVYMVAYYSLFYGYIGNGMQFIFCAEK